MDSPETQVYKKLVSSAARIAVVIGCALVAIKIFAWWLTDSISLFASLADSTLDISASITNLVIIGFALQPADREHNFGHGKLESLAALLQVVIIAGSALFVLWSAIGRFYNHVQLEHTMLGLVIMLISSGLTLLLVWYQSRIIRKTGSQAIKADAMHYKSDLLINLGVMASLLAANYSLYWIDSLVALAITVILLFSAKAIAVEAVGTLMDTKLPESEITIIKKIVYQHSQVLGMHELRSRKAGQTRFIQLHLELPDAMNLLQAHGIADEIEDQLTGKFPGADVLIHIDPESRVGAEYHDTHPL